MTEYTLKGTLANSADPGQILHVIWYPSLKIIVPISQPKHMLCALKRTVSITVLLSSQNMFKPLKRQEKMHLKMPSAEVICCK